MKKTLAYSTILLGLLFITSCNNSEDPEDLEAPVIDLHEPENFDSFESGGDIHFEAYFTDNVALSQFEIDIHGNFDGHAHGRVKSTSLPQFSFKQSFDLSGKSQEIHKHVDIEKNGVTLFAAGPYDFIVNAIDAAGNRTSFQDGSSVEVTILITNDQMPFLHEFDQNIQNHKIRVDAGETLTLQGYLKDVADKGEEPGLEEIEIELFYGGEDGHGHSHRVSGSELEMEWEKDLDGALEYNLSQWEGFAIPANAEHGDYILQIKAVDLDGNIMIRRFIVHID